MQPVHADSGSSRYTSRPFPAYRHIPFTTPHPFLDADGHSYREELPQPASFGPEDWQGSSEYRYCIDLFNDGYWWESHERLKPLCLGAGRETQTGRFLQGLILASAALLKDSLGETEAAETLAEQGVENLLAGKPAWLGIEVGKLIDQFRARIEGKTSAAPTIRLGGL